jgi:signal transduction histidine kinase
MLRKTSLIATYSLYFALLVLLTGALVLVGWQFNIELLKRLIPGFVAMNPATAIGFLLCSFSYLLLRSPDKRKHSVAYVLGALVTCLGLLKLAGLVFSFDPLIDHLLFSAKLDMSMIGNLPNRMAPNTAFAFVLSGLSLIFAHRESASGRMWSQYLAFVLCLTALLSIVGYLYKVQAFYGFMTFIPMALHTAFSFLMIGLAILFLHPEKGIMKAFTTGYAGSVMARSFLPAAISIPVLLGLLRLTGEWNQLYSGEFGTAMFVMAVLSIFILLIHYNAMLINKWDEKRSIAEKKLEKLNSELEQKVQERTLELINSKKTIEKMNKDLELTVEQRTEQLTAVNKELEAFSYSVSHDLRAPLRAVDGYSKMLEEDHTASLNDEGKRLLGVIQYNAQKMGTLIDDLLSFSKLGKKAIHKTDVDMNELFSAVITELSRSLNHKADILIGKLLPAKADYALISQVVLNLLSNAIKYSSKKENPVVEVSSSREDGMIVYTIRDNGEGFDMKYVHKLFGVFQRLHSMEEFEGTGVGLAIVQRIINKHGGKVWAEAELHKGATFYFSLPE